MERINYAILFVIFIAAYNYNVTAQPVTFNYTGAVQTWTVTTGCSFTVEVSGAGGCGGSKGARVTGTLTYTAGTALNIYVGGAGVCCSGSCNTGGARGWNGGGNGGNDIYCNKSGGGGGGASDIRVGGTALSNRVIVAGGAGGNGDDGIGGNGGCTTGVNGGDGSLTGADGGKGGTQSAGGISTGGTDIGGYGSLDTGGVGASPSSGGGYYGGGGGGDDASCPGGAGGGGGGSSLTPGVGVCTSGFQTGNGQVIITCSAPLPVELLYFNATAENNIISIYPNPATDGYIQYTVSSEAGGEVTVKVYDVLGREVISKEETIEAGVTTKKVETQNFASGSYLLQITTKTQDGSASRQSREKTQKQFVIK